MLSKLNPALPPFDALVWPPHVHLALFVHRVEGLVPGVYAYLRDATVCDEWRSAMRPEFLWEPVDDRLFLLLPTDVTWAANRVSCDQEIASDGFFSLGMIARLESALRDRGEWFYRRLFWECGMIGQVLYLEAEAAGSRGNGHWLLLRRRRCTSCWAWPVTSGRACITSRWACRLTMRA